MIDLAKSSTPVNGSESPSTPSLNRPVWHVTQYFWPPRGGQEQLILHMCETAAERGTRSVIIQPLTLSLLKPSSASRRRWPPRTSLVPVPTLAPIISLVQRVRSRLPGQTRLTPQWASDLSWRSFNWSLFIFRPLIFWWCRRATVVVHYHVHQPYFRHPNTVVFSHGVEWRRPPLSALDKLRADSLGPVLHDVNVRHVLANDRDYMEEALRAGGQASERKLELLANPVDTKRFQFDARAASEQLAHRTVVMMRNVRRDRGILEGIQAFLSFRENGHSDWKLSIYGAYVLESEYYKECTAAAAAADGTITFHGHTSSDSVPDILSRSSIALVPSQELEGTSLAALEAMAAGVPCVSTSIGGLKDIPTCKSDSIKPVDIAGAMAYVVSNYEAVRIEQSAATRGSYSLTQWKQRFSEVISKMERSRD